jgi:hypothetical protein
MEGSDCCGCLSLVFTERFAIGAKLISEWLAVNDVARLDSAFCCTGRDKFLMLISFNGVFVNCCYDERFCMDNALEWLLLRRGKLQSLDILHSDSHTILASYLVKHGKFVRHLIYGTEILFSPNEENNLLAIAQNCSGLETCILVGQIAPIAAAALFRSSQQLTSLHAWSLDMSSLVVLTKCCTLMTSLTISLLCTPVTSKKFSALGNLHNLQKLRLHAAHFRFVPHRRVVHPAARHFSA